MRVFFSSASGKQIDRLAKLGARSFLFSFENKGIIKQIKHLNDTVEDRCMIIVDSGAFSCWNKGLVVDIDEYIEFISSVKKVSSRHEIYFVNLDVIPHQKGQKKTTKEQINAACEKGFENYHYIKSHGHSTLHTFHMFEDFKYLDRMLDECSDLDFICLSPANDASADARMEWLSAVYAKVKNRIRTHLLGFTSKEALECFPAYSADSTVWKNDGKFGHSFDHYNMQMIYKQNLDRHTIRFYSHGKTGIHSTLMFFLNLESYISKLWAKRGIKWNW